MVQYCTTTSPEQASMKARATGNSITEIKNVNKDQDKKTGGGEDISSLILNSTMSKILLDILCSMAMEATT